MMKCLYFLLFVAASQAAVAREAREVEDISVPRLTRIALEDDPFLAFKVHWTRVSNHDGEEPVLGYKVKVWEYPKTHSYEYETVDGIRTLAEDDSSRYYSNTDEIPTHKSRNIHVRGADTTTARMDDIESGVTYEVRVLAYTRNGDGPLSKPMRIEISTKDNIYNRQRNEYIVE